MNRWIWTFRILGLLMLLAFALMFMSLQQKLVQMRSDRPAATHR